MQTAAIRATITIKIASAFSLIALHLAGVAAQGLDALAGTAAGACVQMESPRGDAGRRDGHGAAAGGGVD